MVDTTNSTNRLVLTAAVESSHRLVDFFRNLAVVNGVPWDEIRFTHSVWLHSAGEPKCKARSIEPRYFRERFAQVPNLVWVGLDPLDRETLTYGRLTYQPYKGASLELVPHPHGWWVLRVTLLYEGADAALKDRHRQVIEAFRDSVRRDTMTLQDDEPIFEAGLAGFASTEARYIPRVGPYRGLMPQVADLLRQYMA